jgi:hypothetical protein
MSQYYYALADYWQQKAYSIAGVAFSYADYEYRGSEITLEYLEDLKTREEPVDACFGLLDLYKKYGVTDLDALAAKLFAPALEMYGVNTLEDLRKAIDGKNKKNIEIAYKNKTISFADLNYYVFISTRLGHQGLNIFKNENDLVTMKLDQKVGQNVICKLVFKLENSVVSSNIDKYGKEGDRYIFKDVPRGTPVWIVAIKNENGKPFLHIEETTIQAKTYKIEWKEMTIETLRERLKILNL